MRDLLATRLAGDSCHFGLRGRALFIILARNVAAGTSVAAVTTRSVREPERRAA